MGASDAWVDSAAIAQSPSSSPQPL